ncbi:MAG: YbjQ family protein [Defluviitaleaceae bacterium]|nr:YbjQ family protein [Defluviitaleaceae bacterium]
MIIVTSEFIQGKELEHIGLVQGSVVRAKHIGKAMLAGFRAIAGGEIDEYTELMYEARKIATDRMSLAAHQMQADAIVAVRYSTCSVMDGSSEVMAYGTAVKFKNGN